MMEKIQKYSLFIILLFALGIILKNKDLCKTDYALLCVIIFTILVMCDQLYEQEETFIKTPKFIKNIEKKVVSTVKKVGTEVKKVGTEVKKVINAGNNTTTIPETTQATTPFITPITTNSTTTIPFITPITTNSSTTAPFTTSFSPITTNSFITQEITIPNNTFPIGSELQTTTVPQTTVPQTTTVAQTTVPQTTVPQIVVAQTTVPQTTVAQITVAQTTVPQTTVPQTTVPQTTVPQTTTVAQTTVPQTTTAPQTTTVPQTTVAQTTVAQTTVPQTTSINNKQKIQASTDTDTLIKKGLVSKYDFLDKLDYQGQDPLYYINKGDLIDSSWDNQYSLVDSKHWKPYIIPPPVCVKQDTCEPCSTSSFLPYLELKNFDKKVTK